MHGHRSQYSVDASQSFSRGHNKASSSSGSLSNSIFGSASLPTGSYFPTGSVVSRSRSERRSVETKLPVDDAEWLEITAGQLLGSRSNPVLPGGLEMKQAVETMIAEDSRCFVVETSPNVYGFLDFADLNVFLLLVLQATSPLLKSPTPGGAKAGPPEASDRQGDGGFGIQQEHLLQDERSIRIIQSLRDGGNVSLGMACDLSQKNPYHCFTSDTTLHTLLPLLASGLHRVAIADEGERPRVLDDTMILEHLVTSTTPVMLNLAVSASELHLPLHPLISLPGTATVLDAMQVMSVHGLAALGVLSGPGSVSSRRDSTSSASSGNSNTLKSPQIDPLSASPQLMPMSPSLDLLPNLESVSPGDLVSIVTVEDCTKLVVPSEGRKVLSMGLEQMVKEVQRIEDGGRERGEERMPVHTIPFSSTLLHAAHLILATSSSRVFIPSVASPPLSPVPSLSTSQSSPQSSPSLSSLSLSDIRAVPMIGLPMPPPILYSPHYVVSTVDIFSCLAKAYQDKLTPPSLPQGPIALPNRLPLAPAWDLDPASMVRRRRASSSTSINALANDNFDSWRWATRVGRIN